MRTRVSRRCSAHSSRHAHIALRERKQELRVQPIDQALETFDWNVWDSVRRITASALRYVVCVVIAGRSVCNYGRSKDETLARQEEASAAVGLHLLELFVLHAHDV